MIFLFVLLLAASSNNALYNLTISSGTLAPGFTSETLNYEANVANNVASVDVIAVTAHPQASFKINGNVGTQNTASSVDLNVGSNTIQINVTAENGSFQVYTITVIRGKMFPCIK